MVRKASFLIAAAVILGAASTASAQTWRYDQTPDNTLSYGPREYSPPARAAAPAPVGADIYYEHDQTPDNTLSYGARPQRGFAARAAAIAPTPVGQDIYWRYDQTPDNTLSYGARSAR